LNFYWWHQTGKSEGTDLDSDGIIEDAPGDCPKEPTPGCSGQELDWQCRFEQGRKIWRKYEMRGSARFVTLVEERCDFALIEGIQEMGAHGRFSWHNMAFLDGHVEYMNPDTRKPFGLNWTILDEKMEAVGWN
jgi:prepilin-type processing-associated H-X9-DG protein